MRNQQPGWCEIALPDGRRGLWSRVSLNQLELCAGHDGDDAYIKLTAGDTLSLETICALEDVLNTLRFAWDMEQSRRLRAVRDQADRWLEHAASLERGAEQIADIDEAAIGQQAMALRMRAHEIRTCATEIAEVLQMRQPAAAGDAHSWHAWGRLGADFKTIFEVIWLPPAAPGPETQSAAFDRLHGTRPAGGMPRPVWMRMPWLDGQAPLLDAASKESP